MSGIDAEAGMRSGDVVRAHDDDRVSAPRGRSFAVLAAAWRNRARLDGPRRRADELAFLPPAQGWIDTPVHPAPRLLAGALVAGVVAALAWSWWGQLDVVAVARGRIVVDGQTKTVQPLEAGVVRKVLVRDGDRVEAGQLLVELDGTAAQAEARAVEAQWTAAHREAAGAQQLLAALGAAGGTGAAAPGAPGMPPTAPVPMDDAAQARVRSEWGEWLARRARLDAELSRQQSEVVTARAAVAKLEALLPLAQRREADYEALRAEGFVSPHAGQDRRRERLELEREGVVQRARVQEAEAGVHAAREARDAARAEMARALHDRLAQAQLRIRQLEQEGARTRQRERLHELRAPVAGTVQQLAVHTTGGVVTPAQVLMVLVPADAPLVAEVQVDARDIAFVEAGQPATLKFDALPYTRHGTVPATLHWRAADAVAEPQQPLHFPARLTLARHTLPSERGPTAVAPGMAVTAELQVGRRRVLDYLLSPLQQRLGESLRER